MITLIIFFIFEFHKTKITPSSLAKNHGHTNNLTLSSDAFFPFDDVVKSAHTYGVSAIIQPGGSIRDQDSIDACNKLGITMVFTRNRHFKH